MRHGKFSNFSKRCFALLLAVFVLVVAVNPTPLQAAVKLNSTKKTVYVGDSFYLRVSGTSKKVKWSSSKKSVASVNKSGKVTAKKAGKATISAKINKKVLKCKVTVKEMFSASKATKNISIKLLDTGNGVVAILKNNNKIPVSLEAKMAYYSGGGMIGTSSDSNYAFESGMTCALFLSPPYDENYEKVEYDDYKITLSVKEGTNLICGANRISVESDFGAGNVSAEVKNASGKDLYSIQVAVVFYNESGDAVGYEYHYAECLTDGSIDYLSFDFPYDDNYETIYPDSYEVYVNNAYTYTWMD